ncbi:MAG TPA: SRPBCC family protein [Nocardioides sp.]
MAETIHVEARIAATPDRVWEVVGDVADVAAWIPAIESSRLEGDVRHATFAGGGGDARERIESKDDAGRTYTYSYLDGPLALERYSSTITVLADGDGSLVTWDAAFAAGSAAEEAELRAGITGIYEGALAELARQLG